MKDLLKMAGSLLAVLGVVVVAVAVFATAFFGPMALLGHYSEVSMEREARKPKITVEVVYPNGSRMTYKTGMVFEGKWHPVPWFWDADTGDKIMSSNVRIVSRD